MSTDTVSHPAVRFLVRRYVELLTVLAVLFVLQTGLVPFDFTADSPEAGSNALFSTKVYPLTFPDIVSNIFLYVPVGILLHWTLARAVRRRILVIPATILIAVVLSGAVEWLQAYSPARISSLIDFVSNVIGASIGVSISWVCRWAGPRLLGAALFEFHERPQAAMLKTYCLVLVIFAAIPFSFSFDSSRMKKAVKSANFIPFRASTIDEALTDQMLARGDHIAYAHLKWQRMKRWSRWAAECASFVVLAWLLQALLRSDQGFGRGATTVLAWWFGGMFAVGLSVLQLPIISRACDVTDILFRLLGLCLGLATVFIYLGDNRRFTPAMLTRRWRRLAKIGCAATVGYIFYTGLIPLTFDVGSSGPSESLASKGFLPFFAYFVARFDLMMSDAMEKFASYAVFSALLAMCWSRMTGLDTRLRILPIMTLGVAMSIAIEIPQMYIPVRVTSLTDPILAAAGCLTGVLAQQHAVMFYRFASSRAVIAPHITVQPETTTGALAPSDALIAGLMDPRPDAPTEPMPTPPQRLRR